MKEKKKEMKPPDFRNLKVGRYVIGRLKKKGRYIQLTINLSSSEEVSEEAFFNSSPTPLMVHDHYLNKDGTPKSSSK